MITLLIVIVITVGIVCCLGIVSYEEYKEKELDYQKEHSKNVSMLTESETRIEIEREKTKQYVIKSDYRKEYRSDIPEKDYELEIEKEKTKQLEIKERHYKEHGERLYV